PQAETGGHDEVATPIKLAGMNQAGIQIGGEENLVGELGPERLEDQEFVIYVAAQDTDGFESNIAARFELVLQLGDFLAETRKVIHLAVSLRQGNLLGAIFLGLFLAAMLSRLRLRCFFGCYFAIDAPQVTE